MLSGCVMEVLWEEEDKLGNLKKFNEILGNDVKQTIF